MHPLARTTPLIRQEIVDRIEAGESVSEVARRLAISRPTVYKWLARHRMEGGELQDRRPIASSFPTRVAPDIEEQIAQLRRTRRLLGWQIADALELARSTVIKVLKRLGLARLRDLDPPRLTKRYEYDRPGGLVHIDIKKLARFHAVGHRIHGDRRKRSRAPGHDIVFVGVDDASRYGSARSYDREDADHAAHFLLRLAAQYKRRGVAIERVMTDNGRVFTSHAFQAALAEIDARHILTPPYTPQWNGKAERFIQTMLREWAYAVAYRTSDERSLALPAWLRYYNQDRRHSALNHRSPNSRWRAICQQRS